MRSSRLPHQGRRALDPPAPGAIVSLALRRNPRDPDRPQRAILRRGETRDRRLPTERALITNSPPHASRRTESATWPITSALPILPPPDRRLPSSRTCRMRSDVAARPVNLQAGHAPKINVATRLNATVPMRTRQSRSSAGRLNATGITRTQGSQQRAGGPLR